MNKKAFISLNESGFFRDLEWQTILYDKQNEKLIDGWFQYDYGLDLGDETQNN